ncbi:MAG: DUF2232 domain-containing protein [Alphaproteobacteria bacterium]|nr:DUF2232 domain-containing protein [Alphaproteobacteria bacterium]
MSKHLPLAVIAGLLAALFYVSIVTGRQEMLFLSFFTQLPLFLAGLGIGYAAIKVSAIVGVVLCLLMGGIYYSLAFLLLNAAPVVFFVRQALLSRTGSEGEEEWYPLGHLISWVAATAVVMFVALFLLLAGDGQGVEATVRLFLSEVLTVFLGNTDTETATVVEAIAPFFPAFVIGWRLFMVIATGALAQGLVARFNRNVRPSPDFSKMELPDWITYALAVAALLFFVTGPGTLEFFSRNLVLILCIPFFLLGLAVIHAFAGTAAQPRWVLIPFYTLLIMFGGFAAMVVTGFGFVEQVIGIRSRLPDSANRLER